MDALVLYCKSYHVDVLRVRRLAASVQRFNADKLAFYVSCPRADKALFDAQLHGFDLTVLCDEDIVQSNPLHRVDAIQALPGVLAQQIVKSEFWRLGLGASYVCLDSDAVFLRPFQRSDFLAPDGTPYTVLDEAHELLEDALRQRRPRVVQAFVQEADQVQALFGRVGRRYSFGPFPLVWHSAVWQSLDTHYLQPRGLSLADAITLAPIESRWYGEALLAYGAIALKPCQALFKVYHYAWQFDRDRRAGLGAQHWGQMYCGAIYQSAWERELDWPREGGNVASRLGRRLRRALGRI